MSSYYLNFRDIVRWRMVMSLNLDPQKSPKSAFLLLVSSVTAPLIDPFSTDQQPHSSKHMKFTIVAPTQGKFSIKSRQQHSAVIAGLLLQNNFSKKKTSTLYKKTPVTVTGCWQKRTLTLGRGPFWKDSHKIQAVNSTSCGNFPFEKGCQKLSRQLLNPEGRKEVAQIDPAFFFGKQPKGLLKKDSKNWIDKWSDMESYFETYGNFLVFFEYLQVSLSEFQ